MALAILCSDGVNARFDDGTVMLAHEARAAGHIVATKRDDSAGIAAWKKKGVGKTAAAHPFIPGMVITPDKGNMQRVTAEAMGYAVPPMAEVPQTTLDARAEAFASLPEARGKVRSAMRLAANNPDMAPDQARGFLRGAPTDAAITAQRQAPQPTTSATAPTEAERREARTAELRTLGRTLRSGQ